MRREIASASIAAAAGERIHLPETKKGDRGGPRRVLFDAPRARVTRYIVVLVVPVIVLVVVEARGGGRLRGCLAAHGGGLRRHDHGARLHLGARVEHDDGLAGGAQQALFFQHLQHAARHFARAADEARQLLARHLDLHALGMRHRIGLAAQVHDRVRDAAGDIDEGEVAELAVGAIEAGGELRGQLEDQARALGGDLAEARVGHFGELALVARAHPGAARRAVRGTGPSRRRTGPC
jgi:hypothetical protein